MKFIKLAVRLKPLTQWMMLMLCLIGVMTAHAENNTRYLSTDFDAYKKQQALHDQTLMQAKSSNKISINPRQSLLTPEVKQPTKNSKKNQNSTHLATSININQADEQMIMQSLKGVGAVKAKAIVDYRNSNGKFKQAQDLLLVKGIGAATLAKNQDLLRFD